MPELLLELFSEEIPARMQARAADDLARLVAEALASLAPCDPRTFYGPRRIAVAAGLAAEVPESRSTERGPRANAPEQALAGFLRKHAAGREQLAREGDYWVLHKIVPAQGAATLIAAALPPVLRRFPWPKSMRWGGASGFTWVRPLRRILCLLDGDPVTFDLGEPGDDAHGLRSGNATEGHRFMAPGALAVFGLADWRSKLREHYVIVDAAERRRIIVEGVRKLAAERGFRLVDDAGLLDEVAGLVEWPVPLLGRIDELFMDLPPEVMQVSMRVNQRYFALRTPGGAPAPWFAFVANIEAPDGGGAIVTGNERVLRARFADARHFWDLDRKVPLESRLPALDAITFHAKLGSQGDRVRRLTHLADKFARKIWNDGDVANSAKRAAWLAKADLTTGMVGEFPELQGVMGSHYARRGGEPSEVADAIKDHYAPKGPSDYVPHNPVSIAVALADKLDLLAGFFAIGEKPTGSGDPYGLRRAGIGIIRLLLENTLWINLLPLIAAASEQFLSAVPSEEILRFIVERLRIKLRSEGARYDVLDAVFAASSDDDLVRLLAKCQAISDLLHTDDGVNLLTAYRRARNILEIEGRKDGPFDPNPDPALYQTAEERRLGELLENVAIDMSAALAEADYESALSVLSGLRSPVDNFFGKVTVNAPEPELRRNRLRLLARMRDTMNRVADFSKIEG